MLKFADLEAVPSEKRICCRSDCCRNFLADPELKRMCLKWRREWHFTSQRDQKIALRAFHRERFDLNSVETAEPESSQGPSGNGDPRIPRISERSYFFLGKLMCRRAWLILTGISVSVLMEARSGAASGEVDWWHRGFNRERPQSTAMASALWSIIHGLREVMPLKDVSFDDIRMPFSSKMVLFRMLQDWHQAHPCLPKRPRYKLFLRILRSPDFGLNKVVFHRVVEMGRCALCSLLAHKCRSAKDPAAREQWQRLACRHQWLQRAQKTVYAVDRAKAAADFPTRTLYFAMDGGGGHDFVLPHLAGADIEGPSKAVANMSTTPAKVMNAIIHGDSRSHVILSPGCIVAGANHTCESISIVLSTFFEDHKDVPPEVVLQMDNASPNHNILVFAFAGLYVLEQVCETFKIRFEMANHAHDIYDAFMAIHGRRVHRSTFFSWDELVGIIKAAHHGLPGGSADLPRDGGSAENSQAKPSSLMGHDVLVSSLWSLRDFWEWMVPNYHDIKDRQRALSNGSLVNFDRLTSYHDFVIRRDGDNSVGLWAKEYMSDPDDKLFYLGTLINRKLADPVIGGKEPPAASSSTMPQKVEHDGDTLKKLTAVTKGTYKEQFSAARLADALAICRRDWAHFDGRPCSLPAHRRYLPHQLAAILRSAGKRDPAGQHKWPQAPEIWAARPGDPRGSDVSFLGKRLQPRPPRQWVHNRADMCDIQRGSSVPLISRAGAQPRSEEELVRRQPGMGTFVCTKSYSSTALAQNSDELQRSSYWVWRILRIYQIGDKFESPVHGKTSASEMCYEGHLYCPAGRGTNRRYLPCWNKVTQPSFIFTPAEKRVKKMKRSLQYRSERGARKKRRRSAPDEDKGYYKIPVWCILRPANLLPGSFLLTKMGRLPTFVKKYFDQHHG